MSSKQRKSISIIGAALIFIVCMFSVFSLMVGSYFIATTFLLSTNRIFPRVFVTDNVSDTQLGLMTGKRAAIELHRIWNLERSITVSDSVHSWQVSPSDLGLTVDVLDTTHNALNVGHGSDIVYNPKQVLSTFLYGWPIRPTVNFDPDQAKTGLEMLNTLTGKKPVNPGLVLEGTNIVSVPGEMGYSINISDTLSFLSRNPEHVMLSGNFKLILKPDPPPVKDTSAARLTAQELIASPFNLSAYDPITNQQFDWQVEPETLASWLRFEARNDILSVTIDENQVTAYLDDLSKTLGEERKLDSHQYASVLAESIVQKSPITIYVSHNPTTYLIQPGDTLLSIGWKVGFPIWKIVEANPGLNPNKLLAGEVITIPSKDEMLPLPIVLNKRIEISISEQRLRVYKAGKLLSEHIISTGIDKSPTQPGVFQVQTHQRNAYASVWDLHMPYFLGVYEAWSGFMNGIHGLPTLSDGRQLWGGVLGKPASYGCIILDLDSARWLYDWAEDGVIVDITP